MFILFVSLFKRSDSVSCDPTLRAFSSQIRFPVSARKSYTVACCETREYSLFKRRIG